MKFSCVVLFCIPSLAFSAGSEGGHAVESASSETSKKPLPPPAVPGPDNINTYLHLQVHNLTRAEAPRIQDRKLILSWKGDLTPRYVAAAFRHEAFREKHLFWRNQNGVYFLVMDLASDFPSTLEYRLIVDGLWQSDPVNPQRTRNDQGIVLSQVSIQTQDLPRHAGPVQGIYGAVSFSYQGKPGQQIAIVGNFNHWDPFAHFLEESHPGEYHLTLTLPPGTVLYRFVVGTRSFLDPGNSHTGHDSQGGTFSFFENVLTTPARILDAALPAASGSH